MVQLFVGSVDGVGAGGDEGAQLVVGEREHDRTPLRGSLDAEERVAGNLAGGEQPGAEPLDRLLAGEHGAGRVIGLEQVGHPGLQGSPEHRGSVRCGAPVEVATSAAAVGLDGAGRLVLGSEREFPLR